MSTQVLTKRQKALPEKEWKPTEAMLNVLAEAKSVDFGGKEGDWCEKAGSTRDRFGVWARTHDEFPRWWLHQSLESLQKELAHRKGKVEF